MSVQYNKKGELKFVDTLINNNRVVFLQSILIIFALWTVIARVWGLQDIISTPLIVSTEVYNLISSGEAFPHLFDTLRRVVYGFLLTTVLGTTLGILMGMSKFWRKALQDYITVGLAIPSLFAAVFAAMWFGVSDTTPMVAAALIAFPFLTQNVYEGVKNIEYDLLEMSSSFGVPRRRVIWRVIVQSVLPEWFAGARYSFAISWKITTLAELIAASSGIGFMIEVEFMRLSMKGVLAWTAIFALVILLLEYGILQQIEKRVFNWRKDTQIGMMGGM